MLPLDPDVRLFLSVSEAGEADAPEGFDTLVVGDIPIRLVDLVEDELILGMPLVAMHAPDVCAVATSYEMPAGEQADEAAKPFAVLADLKRDPEH